MRHRKGFNHLGRKSPHRKAMLSNMAASLIMDKRIKTTIAKAKALRTYVEPLITKSKEDTTHSRRVVFSYLQNKESVSELFREVAVKVGNRPGGFTRIIKTGNRLGDNAEMCIIELVDYNELMLTEKETSVKTAKKTRRRSRKKPAGVQAEVTETVTEEVVTEEKTEEVKETKSELEAITEAEVQETKVVEEEPKAEKIVEVKKPEAVKKEGKEELVKKKEPKAEVKKEEKSEAKKEDKKEKTKGEKPEGDKKED